MCRMNQNVPTRAIRIDPELQAGYGVEYSKSRFRAKTGWVFSVGLYQPNEFRLTPLFNRHNRAGCFQDDILGGGTKHQFSNL